VASAHLTEHDGIFIPKIGFLGKRKICVFVFPAMPFCAMIKRQTERGTSMKILVRYHDGAVPLTILPQGDGIDLCAS